MYPNYLQTAVVAAILGGVFLAGHAGTLGSAAVYKSEAYLSDAPSSSDNGSPEAVVTLNEPFFDAFLAAIFTDLRAPAFPLGGRGAEDTATSNRQDSCANVITLERSIENVTTRVRFENGQIIAPIAFSGSYPVSLLGCLRFRGWARTIVTLEFDRQHQAVNARVRVQDIQLIGASPIANNLILNLVQASIDRRLNPVEILPASQLSARVPIQAAGGALRLRAADVRPEVLAHSVSLHIIYEFVRDQ